VYWTVILFVVGCGASLQPITAVHALPEPLVAVGLPPDVTREPIPPEADWAVAVEGVEIAPGDLRDGILLSFEKAQRAARLRVAYDEMRSLYGVDIRTWAREREVYERYLRLADEEIVTWREQAERTWWEQHGSEVALWVGLAAGIVLSVSVGAVLQEI